MSCEADTVDPATTTFAVAMIILLVDELLGTAKPVAGIPASSYIIHPNGFYVNSLKYGLMPDCLGNNLLFIGLIKILEMALDFENEEENTGRSKTAG